MIPEFGQLSLALSACLALASAVTGFTSHHPSLRLLRRSTVSMVVGQFVLVAVSFAVLLWCFVTDDFTVAYVANHSNSLLPWQFKVSAAWGGHEGSFLLWILIMSSWMLALISRRHSYPERFFARVLGTMSVLNLGFICFALFTSNPFERLIPMTPLDGADLNPLLQDFGLIVHPPLLYAGYVGLAVPFAFAIAALFENRVDSAWARWSRPWTNFAWSFLTLGIALGSWWAYYELGWGGWWFWDPVENASFMPWLVGTALVHSLAVTEKRGLFASWTVLLAIAAFSLSLLGTFLVRSGVLTSVHAFAADPDRGLFILIFLALVIGGSLVLYALRAPTVASRVQYKAFSREALLLANNFIFVISATTVLLGTLFPLVMDALGQGKYSVGPPYFNAVFVPLMALLVPFMGIGPVSRWKEDSPSRWRQELLIPAAVVALCAVVLPTLALGFNVWVALAVLFSGWLLAGLLRDFTERTRSAVGVVSKWRRLTPSYLGMLLAHAGFAAMIIGVTVVSQHNVEKDLRMLPGDIEEVAGYRFEFVAVSRVAGPNYDADQADFRVFKDNNLVAELSPQKRRYRASGQVMTEAAIDPGVFRDLFIAMGEPVGEAAWAIRLQYKPMIRWIWFGALMIGFGAITTAFDRRYRLRERRLDTAKNSTTLASSAHAKA